jgi:hypothetical protein
MSKTRQVLNVRPSVSAALWEDAAGVGVEAGPLLAARLSRFRRGGSCLPRSLLRTMEQEFGCNLSRVRLHVGLDVDEMAAVFGARAFCLGSDVFLGRGARHGRGGALRLDVLRHELAHVALRIEPETVRFWSHGVHAELTERVCHAFSDELDQLVTMKNIHVTGGKNGLIDGLKTASSNMDVRKRVWNYRYWGDLLFKSLPDKVIGGLWMKLFGTRPTSIAGEGPSHGEGYDYKLYERVWGNNNGKNEQRNQKEQDRHVADAIKSFKADRESWIDDIIPEIRLGGIPIIGPVIGPVSMLEKEWIKSLGNALHITQDRGSHREGVLGFGHDDPRCKFRPGWNPDEPKHDHRLGGSWKRCSGAAYNRALNNSCKVMGQFLAAIGISPHVPAPKKIDCFGTDTLPLEGFRWRRSPYPNPFVRTVRGRRADPRGR